MEAEVMMQSLMTNYTLLKETMRWTDRRILYLMAKAFIGHEERLQPNEIERVRKRLRAETGFFTSLNSVVRDMIIALMVANAKETDEDIRLLMASYNRMKEAGFKSSSYTYFGAYLLQFSQVEQQSEILEKGFKIYEAIQTAHPFITGKEDYAIAISLAQNEQLSGHRPQEISDLIDFYYQGIRKIGFTERDNAQSAAAISLLLLGKEDHQFLLEIEDLVSQLAIYKIKPKPLLYTSLIILAYLKRELVTLDLAEIESYLIEADEHVKVFLDKSYRRTIGLNLFIESRSKDLSQEVTNTVAVALNQLIIQEQVMAAAAASSAAAASASSSSS